MKYLFLSLLLTLFINSSAQGELPTKDGKVVYELIDSSVNASADELYNKAKLWFGDAFRDSREVIQVDDKEGHNIMGKGNFQFVQSMATYTVKFSVRVDTKENKYRVQFYDISHEVGTMRVGGSAEKLNAKKGSDKMKKNINEGFSDLISGLKLAMRKEKKDDF